MESSALSPAYGLRLVAVPAVLGQRADVEAARVELWPAYVAKGAQAGDVRVQPGGLLDVYAWELALVPRHADGWHIPKGALELGQLLD